MSPSFFFSLFWLLLLLHRQSIDLVRYSFLAAIGNLIVCIVALIIAAIFLNLPSNSAIRLEKYNTAISEYNSANNANAYTLTEDNVYYECGIGCESCENDGNEKQHN